MNRPSWESYALELAKTASIRSEDPYVRTGSCALRHDKSVASVGYNGAPKGVSINWSDRDERRKRVIHAEINCLSYCKPGEIWLLACNLLPCRHCMQTIGAYKIPVVVYENVYDKDDFSLILAKEFGIQLIQIDQEKEWPMFQNIRETRREFKNIWKDVMATVNKVNIKL